MAMTLKDPHNASLCVQMTSVMYIPSLLVFSVPCAFLSFAPVLEFVGSSALEAIAFLLMAQGHRDRLFQFQTHLWFVVSKGNLVAC